MRGLTRSIRTGYPPRVSHGYGRWDDDGHGYGVAVQKLVNRLGACLWHSKITLVFRHSGAILVSGHEPDLFPRVLHPSSEESGKIPPQHPKTSDLQLLLLVAMLRNSSFLLRVVAVTADDPLGGSRTPAPHYLPARLLVALVESEEEEKKTNGTCRLCPTPTGTDAPRAAS